MENWKAAATTLIFRHFFKKTTWKLEYKHKWVKLRLFNSFLENGDQGGKKQNIMWMCTQGYA